MHELVDSIIGDNYPVPDRMLVHTEQVVHEYLEWAMCGEPAPEGQVQDLRRRGRHRRHVLHLQVAEEQSPPQPGDTIALGMPIFTPYLEMAHLEDYDLHYVADPRQAGERVPYPTRRSRSCWTRRSRRSSSSTRAIPSRWRWRRPPSRRSATCSKKRPDLILLTDDVYGTFVPGFRSLMGEFPKNTIGVYSYSKYFGCTGWRLGTIAVHEDNIFDEMIANHPEPTKKLLDKRYGGLTLEPRKFAFIDRIVADSRDIALNHTAGLSLPQQVMMSLFSLAELMDTKKDYQKACLGICKKRVEATIEGLGIDVGQNDYFDYYYGLIDFEFWTRKNMGDDVVGVGEGERPPARHRVQAGRGSRHRAAQRQRLRRAGLVGAHLVRQPERSRLRRHRPRGARDCARLRPGLQRPPARPASRAGCAERRRRSRGAASTAKGAKATGEVEGSGRRKPVS